MIVDEKSLNDGYHAESTGGHPSLPSPGTNIRPVSIDDQSEKVKQQQQSENELTFLHCIPGTEDNSLLTQES
jgi:hypothetical protein